jgi:hypothetical protein
MRIHRIPHTAAFSKSWTQFFDAVCATVSFETAVCYICRLSGNGNRHHAEARKFSIEIGLYKIIFNPAYFAQICNIMLYSML